MYIELDVSNKLLNTSFITVRINNDHQPDKRHLIIHIRRLR
jgi:hypothetical protein